MFMKKLLCNTGVHALIACTDINHCSGMCLFVRNLLENGVETVTCKPYNISRNEVELWRERVLWKTLSNILDVELLTLQSKARVEA